MKPSDIELSSVSKNFEFEKLSRDIDSISDVDVLHETLKTYLKLYFKQQETVLSLGMMENELKSFGRKKYDVGQKVIFKGGSEAQRKWGGANPGYHLDENVTYTITNVEVRSQHTRLELEGIEGAFNSVLFEVTNDQ